MPVTGDFAKLGRLISKLEQAGRGDALKELSRNLAEEAIELVREGFSKEQDPYGAAWAPLKVRSGRILQDTGQLRSSFKVSRVSASGFRVSASKAYAAYHQSGTARMVARRMVPDGSLPALWRAQFAAAARDFMRTFLRV